MTKPRFPTGFVNLYNLRNIYKNIWNSALLNNGYKAPNIRLCTFEAYTLYYYIYEIIKIELCYLYNLTFKTI